MSCTRFRLSRRLSLPIIGILALACCTGLGEVARSAAAAAGDPGFRIERLAGANRYESAVAISREFFGAGAPVALVASGEVFADGLAAGPAGDQLAGPVLFVKKDHVPAVTRAEVQRLRPSRLLVLGGEATVDEATFAELAGLTSGVTTRVAGADRFAVAAAVSRTAFPEGAGIAYVASGRVWPDALAGGAAAAVQGAPMLLTDAHTVPAALRDELRRLGPERIMLLGGTASVSSGVAADLNAIAPVERVWGADRYATALAISRRVFGPGRPGVLLATGTTYPDALAGVPATRTTRGPILLTRASSLADGSEDELLRLGPDAAYVLGGTASVSIAVPRLVQRRLGVCWSGFPTPSSGQEVITSVGGTGGTKLAFTLDMGGRLTGAADIVRYLTANQVCTTFFPTSIMAATDEGREVMALIAAHPELFEVGNHTVHHCDLVLGGGGSPTAAPCDRPMTDSFVRAELTDAEAVLRPLSGGMPIRPYWRPPFGSSDSRVRALAASVGYPETIMWSRDTIDWSESTTTAQIIDRVVNPSPPTGTIVLAHLGGYHTGEALPTIVNTLRARGYTFTTLSDLLDG